MLKQLLRRLLPPRFSGVLDYWLHRQPLDPFGGPFNNQAGRLQLVETLIAVIDPAVLVETGAYHGTTTQWLASTGRPVVTVEGEPRTYGFAKQRLRNLRNVRLIFGDSRAMLRSLPASCSLFAGKEPILAYLDAHWNADLPLEEEIDIVFASNPRAVVMIDDFAVADDTGYGFDDYGPGATLNSEYVSKVMARHDLALYYPSLRSDQETGFRRGCAVLRKEPHWRREFAQLDKLRPAASAQ